MQNAQVVDAFGKRNARMVTGEVLRFLLSALMTILRWVVIAGKGSEKVIIKSARSRSKNQLDIIGNIIISLVLLPVVIIGRLVWLVFVVIKRIRKKGVKKLS